MGIYIIHFDDKPWEDLDDEQYYRCKEIPWFSTTKTTISRLTPCTEPDLDAAKKEAYQQGHKDGYNKHDIEKIRKQGYDKGLDDIGNALRLLLFQYSNYTLQTIFGYDTARAVVEHFEGSEIVARIRCYEGSVKQDVETIRKEAYAEGYKEGMQLSIDDAKLKESYQQGLSDAWWYMQKILLPSWLGGYGGDVIREIFEIEENHNIDEVVLNYSASEAIEKIREYERKQEESEEPKKEQSVTVEEVMRQYLETFCLHTGSCVECPLHTPDFTCGRGYHFINKPVSDEEVRRAYATVLQKMEEN